MARDKSLWRARKNNFLGLPWTFTVYELTNDRLFVESGFLNKKEDEVRLYRILDLELNRSLGQRIFGMGTIKVSSSDRSLGCDVMNLTLSMPSISETFLRS